MSFAWNGETDRTMELGSQNNLRNLGWDGNITPYFKVTKLKYNKRDNALHEYAIKQLCPFYWVNDVKIYFIYEHPTISKN